MAGTLRGEGAMRKREHREASLTGLLLYFVVVFEPGELRLGDAVSVAV